MKAQRLTGIAISAAALAILTGAGCGSGEGVESVGAYPGGRSLRPMEPPAIAADAGVPIAPPPAQDFSRVMQQAQAMFVATRTDAFALLPAERRFEAQQTAARVLSEMGGFTLVYEPPAPPPDEEDIVEPQPYRRLQGVMLSNTVTALIEWEDGKVYEVHPGSRVADSEWVVVSIDPEKAVLRRSGQRRPTQIEVKLESPPPGMGRGGRTQGGGAGGGQQAGGAGTGIAGAGGGGRPGQPSAAAGASGGGGGGAVGGQ